MPKRSRSTSVTTTTRKRKSVRLTRARRTRRSVSRSLISRRGNIHAFTRWAIPSQFNSISGAGSINWGSNLTYSDGTLVTNAGTGSVTEVPFSIQFNMNDIPSPADFTTLYDQYKLCGAKITIKMISSPDAAYDSSGASANTRTNFYPTLWYTRDYDDNGLLLLSDIRQYKSVKHVVLRPNKEISIYTKPRLLRQLFATTTGAGYEIAMPKYIDLANLALPHYGFKSVIDFEGQSLPLGSATNQWRFRVNIKYFFMCKNVR